MGCNNGFFGGHDEWLWIVIIIAIIICLVCCCGNGNSCDDRCC